MSRRFKIETIVENGYPHYKIHDSETGDTVHCDFSELNEILYEMMGE